MYITHMCSLLLGCWDIFMSCKHLLLLPGIRRRGRRGVLFRTLRGDGGNRGWEQMSSQKHRSIRTSPYLGLIKARTGTLGNCMDVCARPFWGDTPGPYSLGA
jgi:hypothetical protein